jgi:hypothetical protein
MIERPPNVPGSGHYWAIDIRNGEGNRRERKRKDPSFRGSSSGSRSDEEEDFSKDVDEDRSTSINRRRHGEHGGACCFCVLGHRFQVTLRQSYPHSKSDPYSVRTLFRQPVCVLVSLCADGVREFLSLIVEYVMFTNIH